MPKPLRSDDPNPQPVQFRDFGVLNTGKRSTTSTVISIGVNVMIALMLIFLVKAAVVPPPKKVEANLIFPDKPVPPPPPPPKLPPPPRPKIPPPPPPVKVVETPPVPQPKPVPTPPVPKPAPQPNPTPAPKKMDPPPAPKAVSINVAAASVPNHDTHPSAIRLGDMHNPIQPMNTPAVSPINMGTAGAPGMRASNSGNGPRSVAINAGSGSPNSGNIGGKSPGTVTIAGIRGGVAGGGPGHGAAGPVQPVIVSHVPPAQPTMASAVKEPLSSSTPPVVTYQPKPVYTADAMAKHIEGVITVRIRVSASGEVTVLGLVTHLGSGLDDSAMTAARGIRFKPAKDANGTPVEWTGNVKVQFQLA